MLGHRREAENSFLWEWELEGLKSSELWLWNLASMVAEFRDCGFKVRSLGVWCFRSKGSVQSFVVLFLRVPGCRIWCWGAFTSSGLRGSGGGVWVLLEC